MLAISRKDGQTVIAGNVVIGIHQSKRGRCRIWIQAPPARPSSAGSLSSCPAWQARPSSPSFKRSLNPARTSEAFTFHNFRYLNPLETTLSIAYTRHGGGLSYPPGSGRISQLEGPNSQQLGNDPETPSGL